MKKKVKSKVAIRTPAPYKMYSVDFHVFKSSTIKYASGWFTCVQVSLHLQMACKKPRQRKKRLRREKVKRPEFYYEHALFKIRFHQRITTNKYKLIIQLI